MTLRLLPLAFALLTIALGRVAFAVTSVDVCDPECDSHQLEWRADPADSWVSVGAPVDVTDIVRPDTNQASRGVEWSGLDETPGNEFRGKSLRGNDESPFSSPLVIPEPPIAPLLLASLGVVAFLRWRS